MTANHTPFESFRAYWLRRAGIALRVGLLILLLAPRVGAAVSHLPLSLALARAAGRTPKAGPLFLAMASPAGGVDRRECPRRQTDGDSQAAYLAALACQAEGYRPLVSEGRPSVEGARYRRPFSHALFAAAFQARGATAEARALWQSCPTVECDRLLVRAGTLDACLAAASLSDGSRRASFCVGALTRRHGGLDESLTWFERALAAPPEDQGMWDSWGEDPSPAEILYRMGEIEIARGNVAQAWTLTQKCLAEDPQHYWGMFQHAILLNAVGRPDEAIAELQRTIQRHPTHAAAMFNLGLLFESRRDLAAAEHWFFEARKLLPDKELGDAALRRVKAARGTYSR